MHTYNRFRKIRTIVPETFASTTSSVASTLNTTGDATVSLMCSTGAIWINPLATATTANGFKLNEYDIIDLVVPNSLSIISDSTTAKYQAVIWEG